MTSKSSIIWVNDELIKSWLNFEADNFEMKLIVFISHTILFLFFEESSSLSFFFDFFFHFYNYFWDDLFYRNRDILLFCVCNRLRCDEICRIDSKNYFLSFRFLILIHLHFLNFWLFTEYFYFLRNLSFYHSASLWIFRSLDSLTSHRMREIYFRFESFSSISLNMF